MLEQLTRGECKVEGIVSFCKLVNKLNSAEIRIDRSKLKDSFVATDNLHLQRFTQYEQWVGPD